MTALINERTSDFEKWNTHEFVLASGNKAWKNAVAVLDLSTGKVEPGHGESDCVVIGKFAATADATLADTRCSVKLIREIEVEWLPGTGFGPTDLGKLAYLLDDNTVTLVPNGTIAGRIWAYDAIRGVGVELTDQTSADGGGGATEAEPVVFTANNVAIADGPASGAVYDVPTTSAASTITMPATAAEGTQVDFVADGTKNGHTVTYRDATGPVALTTALLANKRHQVHLIFLNGIWTANAYVSP